MASSTSTATDTLITRRALVPSRPPTSGPVRILALDGAPGGAIRGLAQIKIVRALMQEIWKKENVGKPLEESEIDKMRPCDHFNMILGSGTGGAVAIYLGRLNLSIKECEDFYKQLGDEVYGHPFSAWNFRKKYKYDHERMKRVLEQQTKPFIPETATALKFGYQRENSPGCKVAVLTKMAYNAQALHLIKSYEPNNGEVWQAIRATTATYWEFPNIKVGYLLLLGPEAGFNNPSGKAWVEATTLYPKTLGRGLWFISVGSASENANLLDHPLPNAWEKWAHTQMSLGRSSLKSACGAVGRKSPDVAKAVVTSVGTWAGYGWEFARGKLPGRAKELRLLAAESASRHQELRDRMRRSSLDPNGVTFRYYRLNLKLDEELFAPNAWTANQKLLKSTLSSENPDLLPEAQLMRTINMARGQLLPPANQPNLADANTAPLVRILTLDGTPGGISAVVQLRILRGLMEATLKKERESRGDRTPPSHHDIDVMRPYDYFDLIVGSGTGGAIAVYLGWFRLTIQECEPYFRTIGNAVYAQPFSRWNIWQKYNYDHKILEEEIKGQVRGIDIPTNSADPQQNRRSQHKFCYQRQGDSGCKVAVLASNDADESTGILRSYQYEGLEGAHNADVWEVMHATMACHNDFAPVRIGNVCLRGPDTAFSNPLDVAYQEAQRIFGLQRSTCIISIGNGLLQPELPIQPRLIEDRIQDFMIRVRTKAPALFNLLVRAKIPNAAKSLQNLATGCENEHRKLMNKMRPEDLSHYFDPASSGYFRFNIFDKEGLLIDNTWNNAESRVQNWASQEYLSEDMVEPARLGELGRACQFL